MSTLTTSNSLKFLNKLWTRLSQMDECKYLVPRFSNSMQELAEFFNIKIKKRHKSHIRKQSEHFESFENDKNEEESERINVMLKPKRIMEKPSINTIFLKPNLSVINEGNAATKTNKVLNPVLNGQESYVTLNPNVDSLTLATMHRKTESHVAGTPQRQRIPIEVFQAEREDSDDQYKMPLIKRNIDVSILPSKKITTNKVTIVSKTDPK